MFTTRLERLEYLLKAIVAGAASGIAVVGGFSFLPSAMVTLEMAITCAVLGASSLALYTYVMGSK